jgi:hypothetical protein
MQDIAISLLMAGVGVFLLVLLSLRLGFSGVPRLESNAEAAAIASGLPGGFDVKRCIMGGDRHCALLFDEEGRRAIILPHGAHFIARLLGNGARLSHNGHMLIVQDAGLNAHIITDFDGEFGKTCAGQE